ncbi:hypothetical protein A2W24_00340 [Microgenomates group bacterium RBG_16_45_19]|nr:MAG: hypothetical protein A2W24_00340 [Microgenomates group bacterium RBG_16_45_19]
MFHLYRAFKSIFLALLLSFGLPPNSCRFTPSCSHYCDQAFRRYGLIKGGWLCLKRVSRCRPGVAPGPDLLP